MQGGLFGLGPRLPAVELTDGGTLLTGIERKADEVGRPGGEGGCYSRCFRHTGQPLHGAASGATA